MRICIVRVSCAFVVSLAACFLSECSPLDVYAFRAVQYNFEAEETQNQVILLNIVRSSLHRPMEFTEITNIVGSNSASGNTSFSFPVGFRLPTGVTTGTAGASLTGTTTFTIPVLDTQDFYEGLLNDIQPSLLAYYLQTPFISKELLLNLFIERIVVHVSDRECANSHAATCERDFRNNPYSAEDIALFQTFVDYLLGLQVSAEPVKAQKTTQTIKANGATINISGSSSGSSSDSSGGGSGGGGATPYRLCFSPRGVGRNVPLSASCGYVPPKGTGQSSISASTKVDGIYFAPELAQIMLDDIRWLGDDDHLLYKPSIRHFSGRLVSITLQFRSTASIFNYLGQLVSEAAIGKTYPLNAKYDFKLQPKDWVPCWMSSLDHCKPIIAVNGLGTPSLVTVNYNAGIYSVPGDPNVSYSPDVFTILKQLVALNLSGKNLPTTAILSLTSAGP